MKKLLSPALCLAALGLAGCEVSEPEPLTDLESELIYNQMVTYIFDVLTASAEGPVSETVPCPVEGVWGIEGSVVGSSSDRGFDVVTTATDCGIGGYDADGNEAMLRIGSTGVSVFMPQPDDTTPFSAYGDVSWTRTEGFGSGACTIETEAGCQ